MVRRQWHKNVFKIQWRKICCCWKNYKTLKEKIYEHMPALSKNVCFNLLNHIVDKYNNTYHGIIKMKPFDVR